jgi:UDP-N-acetyl-D-mannosaminuronic acid transferase (WecB/TagA/CpsF family)
MSTDGLLETIVTSTWTVPAEVTDTTDAVVNEAGRQATSVFLAGSTPGEYEIVNEIVTSSGAEYQAIITLTIE